MTPYRWDSADLSLCATACPHPRASPVGTPVRASRDKGPTGNQLGAEGGIVVIEGGALRGSHCSSPPGVQIPPFVHRPIGSLMERKVRLGQGWLSLIFLGHIFLALGSGSPPGRARGTTNGAEH